jgi:ATPase subunit of ABC transporter with duplicated ATPase domains
VKFKPAREAGDQLLRVEGLTKTLDGAKVLDNVSFTLRKGAKVAFVGDSELGVSALFDILMGETKADSGTFTWGVTTTRSYFPKDNAKFFDGVDLSLIDWLRQWSPDQHENFVRGFLGQMLFSGEEATKKTKVLSGGERVRCMLARMMMIEANVVILDGPTNHLDLESIQALNNPLIAFPGTVLVASHEPQFVQTVANQVIEIGAKGVRHHDGDFESYIALKAAAGEKLRA